jgi:predicted glycosyltransferase involved in capsule biosynthesis
MESISGLVEFRLNSVFQDVLPIYFLNMCQSNVFLIADLMFQTCFIAEVGFSDYNNFNTANYNGH